MKAKKIMILNIYWFNLSIKSYTGSLYVETFYGLKKLYRNKLECFSISLPS
jgi:hypothetical protein